MISDHCEVLTIKIAVPEFKCKHYCQHFLLTDSVILHQAGTPLFCYTIAQRLNTILDSTKVSHLSVQHGGCCCCPKSMASSCHLLLPCMYSMHKGRHDCQLLHFCCTQHLQSFHNSFHKHEHSCFSGMPV